MDAIERQIVLPPGADRLQAYARFYTAGGAGEVLGTYVSVPAAHWPIGQRRWVDSAKDLPTIDDGGCSVISLVYDVSRRTFRDMGCNGPPPPDADVRVRPTR